MKKERLLRMGLVGVFCLVGVALLITGCAVVQPVCSSNDRSPLSVEPERLKAHVVTLSETFHPRDWQHPANLERCADYITEHFERAGAILQQQPFKAAGRQYRNVIGRFGPDRTAKKKVVIGAHYDAFGDTPGADDNASGVAVLIELAYLFGRNPPDRPIELVAYSLEEPPFFKTDRMGSAVHAAALAKERESIQGIVVLEMVGYFRDERGTQSYPFWLLRLLYPSRGNFIGVVGRWDQGAWVRSMKAGMKGVTDLPVWSICAPAAVPGVDFSDHHNYWPYGIQALMITDTAFYRNRAYHSADDTADQLDFNRMADVAVATYEALSSLD